MNWASVNAYLPHAAGLSQACIPLGFFTAFCLQHRLLNPTVEQQHAETVARCRFQEGPVSALFVALGAELTEQHLNPQGQAFAERVLPSYLDRYRTLFGEDCWQTPDEWPLYQLMAASLVRDLYGQPPTATASWPGRVFAALARLWR